MKDQINNEDFQNGSVSISEDVVSTITNIALNEIEGIAKVSTGLTGGITEKLGMKNLTKGISTIIEDGFVKIEADIAIEYGNNIKEVSLKAQKSIKENIETMTEMTVDKIDINVVEVVFPKDNKKDIIEK